MSNSNNNSSKSYNNNSFNSKRSATSNTSPLRNTFPPSPPNKLYKSSTYDELNKIITSDQDATLNSHNLHMSHKSKSILSFESEENITSNILPQTKPVSQLSNYFTGPMPTYNIVVTKAQLSQMHMTHNGVCLYDFNGLTHNSNTDIPACVIAEGVILVNLSDLIPKSIIDALLADYTLVENSQNYDQIIKPFINKFSESNMQLLIRLYSLRLQNYVITFHLDIANSVNRLFRRNSKSYKNISATGVNKIIKERLNMFLTDLFNNKKFRFAEYDRYLSTIPEVDKSFLDSIDATIPANNVGMFNYIIAIQRDGFHLSDTSTLSYILNTVKSCGKYTSPNFPNNIYFIGRSHSPDLQNPSSGINSNLTFLLANEHISKEIYPLPNDSGSRKGEPIFIDINTFVKTSSEYILHNTLSELIHDDSDIGDSIPCTVPMYSDMRMHMKHTANILLNNIKQSKNTIKTSYTDMLRPPTDDPNNTKYLLIGVNLDIEFDRYILTQLKSVWNNSFKSGNMESGSGKLPYKPSFGNIFGMVSDTGAAMSSNPLAMMLQSITQNIKTTGDSSNKYSSAPRSNPFEEDGDDTSDNIGGIMTTGYMIIGPDSGPSLGSLKTTLDKDQIVNYVHIPYGVNTDQLDNTECLDKLKFDKVSNKRRVNAMYGSALTYDMFVSIANHIIDSAKYPEGIQARFIDFQINTRLRLALGYKAYLEMLDKTIGTNGVPSTDSSYLYFRFQQWCRWVKSEAESSTPVNGSKAVAKKQCGSVGGKSTMECCQCCRCVSQREIQYYTFGHIPLISDELMEDITVESNQEFWIPRF